MTNLTLRAATPADQPALLAIVWQTILASERDRDILLANPEVVQLPLEQLTPATSAVAEIDGRPTGFAIVLPRPDGDAELDGLFVDPAHQRHGIGRALIAEASRLTRAQGASTLHVIANADALAFYEAVGFVVTGTTDVQFGTAILMQTDL
ncbi:MAG: GNAT family N-acetyltransferase [Devosia sp.]